MLLYVAVIYVCIAVVLSLLCVAVAIMTGNAAPKMIRLCVLIGTLIALPTTQFVVRMFEG